MRCATTIARKRSRRNEPILLWIRLGRRQWTLCLRAEAATVAGDVEALHDFRVTLRRLRVWLRVSEPFFVEYPLRRWERSLRMIQKALGPARDADIAVAYVIRNRRDGTGQHVLTRLKKFRATRKQSATRLLKSVIWVRMKDRLRRFWREIPAKGHCDENELFERALEILRKTLKKVKRQAQKADPGDTQGVHQLRIVVRRMRYLAEFFEPFMGSALGQLAGEMKKTQDLLGAVHDLDVVLSVLSRIRVKEAREIRKKVSTCRGALARSLPEAFRSLYRNAKRPLAKG